MKKIRSKKEYFSSKRYKEQDKKINKLKRELNSVKGSGNTRKGGYHYGKKKFNTKKDALAYLNKIKKSREERYESYKKDVKATREVKKINKLIKSGKVPSKYKNIAEKFPRGIKLPSLAVKGARSKVLGYIKFATYENVAGRVIGVGTKVSNSTIENLGRNELWIMTRYSILKHEDYKTIERVLNKYQSEQWFDPIAQEELITTITTVLSKYSDEEKSGNSGAWEIR